MHCSIVSSVSNRDSKYLLRPYTEYNIKCIFKILNIRLVINVFISYSVLIILHYVKKKKKVNLKLIYKEKTFMAWLLLLNKKHNTFVIVNKCFNNNLYLLIIILNERSIVPWLVPVNSKILSTDVFN